MNQEAAQLAREERAAKKEVVKELEIMQQMYANAVKVQDDLRSRLGTLESYQERLVQEVRLFDFLKELNIVNMAYDFSIKIYKIVILYKFKNWNTLLRTKIGI